MSVTVASDKSWDWELFLALLKIGVIRALCANSLSFILEHFRRTGKEGERQKAKALTLLYKKQANLALCHWYQLLWHSNRHKLVCSLQVYALDLQRAH